jgi:hypothetical protein
MLQGFPWEVFFMSINRLLVRFDVLMVVTTSTTIFWHVTCNIFTVFMTHSQDFRLHSIESYDSTNKKGRGGGDGCCCCWWCWWWCHHRCHHHHCQHRTVVVQEFEPNCGRALAIDCKNCRKP